MWRASAMNAYANSKSLVIITNMSKSGILYNCMKQFTIT